MSFKNNLKKLMVCGASLLMVLSTGAGISNVSAKRVNHARHHIIYRVNDHKSRKAHKAKKAKGTKRARKAKRAKTNKTNKRTKRNKRAKANKKHKKVTKKSKRATRAKKAKKSRRAHKSASNESDYGFFEGTTLGSSLVNTKENEFDGVTGLSDPTPSVELRWGLRTEGFRRGLLAGFKVEDAKSKKEHVIQTANNRTAKQLKTLLNIGKIKNKKTYNRTYNKVMKQMKAEQAAINKKSIKDAEEADQETH